MYEHIQVPRGGERILRDVDGRLQVPDTPLIPFIEGDGTGTEIVPVMRRVVDAAVAKAYDTRRRIAWMELYAGEKALARYGPHDPLPGETIEAIRTHLVAIKGPLSAGVGGGTRSLSAALRRELDCYAQVRPVRYLRGTPSPLRDPTGVDMVIFRETSEDIYAGIEWGTGSPEARRLLDVIINELGVTAIRFPATASIGIKPISREGSTRLLRRAIDHAVQFKRKSVTMVHKGTVMKVTEGWFAKWGYDLARNDFGAVATGNGNELRIPCPHGPLLLRDTLTDSFMQQVLLRPEDFDVIATMCQNGDFISSAVAAQVGGVGVAPGANLGDTIAFFEPGHGSAPHYAGQDKVNPSAQILSAQMMLSHLGWQEAAELVGSAVEAVIAAGCVTYELARHMDGVQPVSTTVFGRAVVKAIAG